MKKNTSSRFCSYTLIGIISLTSVLGGTTSAFPQILKTSLIKPNYSTNTTLIWPTQGILSQGFRKYQHEGIDIAGASGTPIFAAASGIVIKAGWDDWGLGNFIEIKHPNGSVTIYGHNRRLLVSKGQEVNQGQLIAEMGSTGNSTAPHLHFEFHPDSRLAVDPLHLLLSATDAKTPPKAPISDSQPIISAVNTDNQCGGVTVIAGETSQIRVQVCNENGQLFYIGQLKQNSSKPVKIAARNVGKNKYRADNGTFSYLVSPEKVEVWRYGSQIRSDNFNTSNSAGN
jgi:lipoprotein NlpD